MPDYFPCGMANPPHARHGPERAATWLTGSADIDSMGEGVHVPRRLKADKLRAASCTG